jgi:hypothetical protein
MVTRVDVSPTATDEIGTVIHNVIHNTSERNTSQEMVRATFARQIAVYHQKNMDD